MLTDKQKFLLDKIKNEGHLIGHKLGFEELNEFNSKIINKIICGKTNTTFCSHRCSYKSVSVCIGIALYLLTRVNDRVFLIVKNKCEVDKMLNIISNILESDTFQEFSQILYGVDFKIKKGDNSIGNCFSLHQVNLVVVTADMRNLLGRHEYNLYIIDDIVNFMDAGSNIERKKHLELYNLIKAYTGDKRRRFILVGSTWHYDDIFGCDNDEKYIYDCYSTNIIAKKEINRIRKCISPFLFASNYLCNPFKVKYIDKFGKKVFELIYRYNNGLKLS